MTFKDKSITKLYAFAMAAVFALVLAGCGGGGGSAAVEEEPPVVVEPEPTPQEMCEGNDGEWRDGACVSAEELAAEMAEAEALSGAQDAAMAAYMAAMAAVGGAKDPVAMGNAQPHAAMAKEASDMAAAATTSEMAMEYQMKAEMYRDMAMEAAGMRGLGLTTLANKITNQAAIDNAVLEGKTGDAVPKPDSNAKRVGTELAATAVPADTTDAAIAAVVTHTTVDDASDPPVPGGSVAQGGLVSATATYGASGPSIAVTPGNTLTTFNAVTKGETPQGLTTRGGWMGAELVGTTADTNTGTDPPNGSMTYANVYTDIQAPAIKDTYAAADATNTILNAALVTSLGDKPEITGDVPSDGSDFAAMYNEDPEDNEPPVTGMFDCPTTAGTPVPCSISVKDGVITAIQGYIFRPRTGVGDRKVDDTDYLAWGIWLHVPNNPATAAAAGAFASGNDAFEVRAALKGTATYNGVASGVYSAGGMVEYFDADVSLMANFGGTVGADSDPGDAPAATDNDSLLLGAVTGSVSNIRAGGMDVAGSLTLKRAPVTRAAAADTGSTTGFEGAASGTLAGRAMAGRWGGQFYGPNDASGKGIETEYPTTAAGTFGASAPGNINDPIRILGAFGTWKAE